MATSWKSQIAYGTYRLQFETDDIEKYNLVEKASQMAVDGKTTEDFVEVNTAALCGLQTSLDVVREYRRRKGDDPVFEFSDAGANKIGNHYLEMLGKEPRYEVDE